MGDATGRAAPSNRGTTNALRPAERRAISAYVDLLLTPLSLVFVLLLVVEFAFTLSPAQGWWVRLAGWLIWAIFAIDFFVRLALARSKTGYLRSNWLMALAVVVLDGGALYSLERGRADATITSFPEALWFTAATLTTVGSQDYPVTAEGRMLTVLLMIYGLGVAGFITAILAAFLVGRRDQRNDSDLAALRDETHALREQLAALHGSSALSSANRVPRPRAPASRHRGNGSA